MKKILHIIFLFAYPLLANSQNYLKGAVKDEVGSSLPNANIFVHSSGYVYRSGSDGSFGIILGRRIDTITVSLDGFQKQKLAVDATQSVEIRLKKAIYNKSSGYNKLASLTVDLKRETQQQWFSGDETYASLIENQFINTGAYPATGLSVNVDRASYSNIRRFISMNTVVPPDAVRIEEMLNYFNLDYQPPSHNKTFEIDALVTSCPWNKDNQLMFARIRSRKLNLDSLPPTHLVFLVDISGSMDMPNRLPLLKSGFKGLVTNLRAKDSVSIVVYGGVVGIALPTTGGDEKEKIFKVIDSLQPGGSTPGESGVKLAYSVARNHFIPKGNNRVILATDGDFNVGVRTDEELEELISTQRETGIYLTCLGVGMGNYKDSKIQTLAQRGNGNFAYIDSYAEGEKVLMKEFTQTLYSVADDAYLNVKFDPDYVKEYRVIGFDNKVGAIKDKEAAVEGGEVGSAYSCLIAFEIVPTQTSIDHAKTFAEYRPASFSLSYKLPENSKINQLTESPLIAFTTMARVPKTYQFASSVIMFGSLLRKSKYLKDVSWNEIIQVAAPSIDMDNYSQREFLNLLHTAKGVYGKKRKGK